MEGQGAENIKQYGFPVSYPLECVPQEIHDFMDLLRGENFEQMLDAATAEGYEPLVAKLDQLSPNVRAVALTVRGSIVPVVVRVGA